MSSTITTRDLVELGRPQCLYLSEPAMNSNVPSHQMCCNPLRFLDLHTLESGILRCQSSASRPRPGVSFHCRERTFGHLLSTAGPSGASSWWNRRRWLDVVGLLSRPPQRLRVRTGGHLVVRSSVPSTNFLFFHDWHPRPCLCPSK